MVEWRFEISRRVTDRQSAASWLYGYPHVPASVCITLDLHYAHQLTVTLASRASEENAEPQEWDAYMSLSSIQPLRTERIRTSHFQLPIQAKQVKLGRCVRSKDQTSHPGHPSPHLWHPFFDLDFYPDTHTHSLIQTKSAPQPTRMSSALREQIAARRAVARSSPARKNPGFAPTERLADKTVDGQVAKARRSGEFLVDWSVTMAMAYLKRRGEERQDVTPSRSRHLRPPLVPITSHRPPVCCSYPRSPQPALPLPQ